MVRAQQERAVERRPGRPGRSPGSRDEPHDRRGPRRGVEDCGEAGRSGVRPRGGRLGRGAARGAATTRVARSRRRARTRAPRRSARRRTPPRCAGRGSPGRSESRPRSAKRVSAATEVGDRRPRPGRRRRSRRSVTGTQLAAAPARSGCPAPGRVLRARPDPAAATGAREDRAGPAAIDGGSARPPVGADAPARRPYRQSRRRRNQAFTGARRTLSVCVRGRSASGQRRHAATRWCGRERRVGRLHGRRRATSSGRVGSAGTSTATSRPGARLEHHGRPHGAGLAEGGLHIVGIHLEAVRQRDPVAGPAQDRRARRARRCGPRPRCAASRPASSTSAVASGASPVAAHHAGPRTSSSPSVGDLTSQAGQQRARPCPAGGWRASVPGDGRALGAAVALHDAHAHRLPGLLELRLAGSAPPAMIAPGGRRAPRAPAEQPPPEPAWQEAQRDPPGRAAAAPARRSARPPPRSRRASGCVSWGTAVMAVIRSRRRAVPMAVGVSASQEDERGPGDEAQEQRHDLAVHVRERDDAPGARSGRRPHARLGDASARCGSTWPWVRHTPLGSLVVPLVNTISASVARASTSSPVGAGGPHRRPGSSSAASMRTTGAPRDRAAAVRLGLAGQHQRRLACGRRCGAATPSAIRRSRGTTTAPRRQAANMAATSQGSPGPQVTTRSPWAHPRAASRAAARRERSPRSAYVQRSSRMRLPEDERRAVGRARHGPVEQVHEGLAGQLRDARIQRGTAHRWCVIRSTPVR